MKRTPLRRITRLRPRARKPKRGVVRDLVYLYWLHTQPCIVTGLYGVEVHHVDRPRNDYRAVPLKWNFHRETIISVHGGGGRRRFEARFEIDFENEIARLQSLYAEETGRKVAA